MFIYVSYSESLNPEAVLSFKSKVNQVVPEVNIKARPDLPFASFEWFIPAAMALFIGKEYFSGILNKLGEEHLQLLSAAFRNYRNETKETEITLIGSKGKLSSNFDYSLMISIEVQTPSGIRLKLLLPKGLTPEDIEVRLNSFFNFIENFKNENLTDDIKDNLSAAKIVGNQICISVNEKNEIIFPNPMS